MSSQDGLYVIIVSGRPQHCIDSESPIYRAVNESNERIYCRKEPLLRGVDCVFRDCFDRFCKSYVTLESLSLRCLNLMTARSLRPRILLLGLPSE